MDVHEMVDVGAADTRWTYAVMTPWGKRAYLVTDTEPRWLSFAQKPAPIHL
jgi:hypothetical protein